MSSVCEGLGSHPAALGWAPTPTEGTRLVRGGPASDDRPPLDGSPQTRKGDGVREPEEGTLNRFAFGARVTFGARKSRRRGGTVGPGPVDSAPTGTSREWGEGGGRQKGGVVWWRR